ncbi:hypothetical protein, partial [Tahibacter caeni]|uniref:hypothetical protein n=1 Tax=Tahibacter caeni TaxID=1453545 RepID=UPI0021486B13
MAKMTPLAKGLVTLIILGGTAAAAWHLGLKEIVQGKGTAAPAAPAPAATSSTAPAGTPAATTAPARPAAPPAAGG